MIRLNIDQRVHNEFLGEGTIVKIVNGTNKKVFAYMVLFDNDPPKEYNCGANPCAIWPSDINVL